MLLHTDRAELLEVLTEVADSNFLTEGKFVRMFEGLVADWADQRAVAVSSCGAGLFAVFRQFEPTTVIVPANTFFATGAMAREAGHDVVLADCADNDFSMGLQQLSNAYYQALDHGKKVGLVVLTHVGWLAKEYEEIAFWCAHRGIPLIEDAAHVFGAKRSYKNGRFDKFDHKLCAGQLGCAAVFSFYPTKAVPVGEGGCVVTKDQGLAQAVSEFRNYGKRRDGEIIRYSQGFNLRMDEWTAAVACLQTMRVDEIYDRRADAALHLSREAPLHPAVPTEGNMWYKFPVESALPAAQLAGKIYQLSDQLPAAMGIGGRFPNAEDIARGHKCLPIGEIKPDVEAILGKVAA